MRFWSTPLAPRTAITLKAPALDCEHFSGCPGCSLSAQLDDPPLMREARQWWEEEHNVRLLAVAGEPHGWRTTAKLAVRASSDGPRIGLFARGSHEVVSVPRCVVHHPAINAAAAAVQSELDAGGLSAFDEATHAGALRYLQLSVERSSATVQLTLVCNAVQPTRALRRFAGRLWAAHGPERRPGALLHSIWLNCNPTRTNNILAYTDGAWVRMEGEESVIETLPSSGATVRSPPIVFRHARFSTSVDLSHLVS